MIPDRDRPIDVDVTETELNITLANQRQIKVSLADYPVLAQATSEQRANVQLALASIYWPDLNLDISLLELLGGTSATSRRYKARFCEG